SGETRPTAMPAAHALLALLPYRTAADRTDLAGGIHDLAPLADTVSVYASPPGSGRTVDVVEAPVDEAGEPLSRTKRTKGVWAEVRVPAASRPALRVSRDMEAMHE